ncbi:hypothetical protein ACJX0J_002726, partial (mitochondrion) [Zea mays]
ISQAVPNHTITITITITILRLLSLFYFRVFFLMEVPGDYERKKHHFSTLDEKKINGIVDLVTFKEKMTFASECYKLVVVIALLRISIWEVRWKTGAFKSRLFLPIWDTPPSHDNHSASTKDGFSIDFRTYRDLLFH